MWVLPGILALYLFLGISAIAAGVWIPEYSFLSVDSDPYFSTISLLVGTDVCIGTGGIIVLYLMRGVDTVRSQISVLAAFIGFGFGASLIHITLPTVLPFVNIG